MSCPACGEKGVLLVRYESGDPDEYAVCLCPVGQTMRTTRNAGRETGFALWQVWAAREQVDPMRMFALEDIFTGDELRAWGFGIATATTRSDTRESALLNASRKRPKL
jgi:hypothetical protein